LNLTPSATRRGDLKLRSQIRESGINVQGVDVISAAKDAKLIAPETLEIRFSKGTNDESVLRGLAEKVKRFTGEEQPCFQTPYNSLLLALRKV